MAGEHRGARDHLHARSIRHSGQVPCGAVQHLAREDHAHSQLGVPHAGARLAIAGQAVVLHNVGAAAVPALLNVLEGHWPIARVVKGDV